MAYHVHNVDGPYTVADEYVIPVPDNTLYSDEAYEVAKKIFPLGEFAEKIVIDFVHYTRSSGSMSSSRSAIILSGSKIV